MSLIFNDLSDYVNREELRQTIMKIRELSSGGKPLKSLLKKVQLAESEI